VSEFWALLRDPRLSTSLVLGAAVAAGLGLLALGWRGAAATLLVPFQVPYLVSGAFVGLALIGASLGLLSVHLDRVEAAEERRRLAELQRDALRLLTSAAERRG
jgi:F0F1-type ATP synthase membrane subunit c/vacuolar-type H+-ATPase subunit K